MGARRRTDRGCDVKIGKPMEADVRLYRNLMCRVREGAGRAARRTGIAASGALLVAGFALALAGCGGAAAGGPGPQASPETRPPAEGIPDALTTDRGEIYNVTIYSTGGQIFVDKLEIEFNRRRGIHAFYGFYRDDYAEMLSIPFRDLLRVDFLGPMPPSMFDQAIIGREDQDLRREYAFELRLTYRDNRQEEFFAIIPKLRGEKDYQLWEFTMNSAVQAIDYIEFSR
jgi:hypothetical protein